MKRAFYCAFAVSFGVAACDAILGIGTGTIADSGVDGSSSSDASDGGTIVCDDGETACGATCVYTQSNMLNCGYCGHSCQGGACTTGACQPVTLATVDAGQSIYAIAVDEVGVYWTTFAGNGAVTKVPIDGGPVTTLASAQDQANGIAADSTSVYWVTYGDGTVNKIAIDGGASVPLASGQVGVSAIRVDSRNAYWTVNTPSGTVMRVALDGGAAVPLASGQGFPQCIAVDSSNVYWTNWTSSGSVMLVPLDGGSATPLASNQGHPRSIAVDSTHVYWSNDTGTVMEVETDGGGMTTLASVQVGQFGLAADSTGVFWVDGNAGTVVRCAPGGCGGSPTVLATGQSSPGSAIAVDATSIYWSANGGTTLMKMSKP